MADAASRTDLPALTISFRRGDTDDPACAQLADQLYEKFTAPHPSRPWVGAYQDGCSILALPSSFETYWEGAAGYYTRRKVRKALKSGYTFSRIERDRYLDDIHEINTSLDERQGRPMTEAYRKRSRPFGPLPDYRCPRHQIRTYGVLKDERLVAYTWVYQVGEVCLFSTILGHGDHLADGVMFQLVAETLRDLIEHCSTSYAMYNMHFSGTDGLRFFKEQMGFAPAFVLWQRNDEPVTRPTPPERSAGRRRAAGPAPIALARRVAHRLGVAGAIRHARDRLGSRKA